MLPAVLLWPVLVLAAAPSNWQPIDCVPADPPPEARFEVVQAVSGFEESTSRWRAENGAQNAQARVARDTFDGHGGKASLRVDYDFKGQSGLEYLQVNGAAAFTESGLGFGFWLKHDGTPFVLRLRIVDAGGEWHQIALVGTSRPGWQFVAGALDTPSEAWGGDGNQRKDYPCKLGGIVLDRPEPGFVGKGSLWIDDAAVVRPRKPESRPIKVEVSEKRFGNLYATGESLALRASGAGEQLRWSAVDFFGHELARGEGPASGTESRFAFDRPGWFACQLELLAGGQVVGAQVFPWAVLAPGEPSKPSDFVGVCTHYGQNAYPLETMDLMRRYGIDQFRDEVSWGSYEAEKGRLALPGYAATYLKRAAELKLRPLLIFDYANRHYDNGGYPNSDEAIAAFGRYAVDLVKQTRGMVSLFEVWNEWVGGCGMNGRPGTHDGEAYGRLLKPTYAAVKQAFPDVTVVGIGGEYGPKCADHILGAIRTGGSDSMDAWSIHPYRYPRPPERSDLIGEVSGIATKVAAAGTKSKAWITEIGYPTHRTSGGSDEATQARLCVRTLVSLQSVRSVEKVFWYDLKDDGLNRDYNEHNFGLIRHQQYHCAPKPGIVAMSVFIRMTEGAEFKELRHQGDTWNALYRHADGREVLVAWTTKGSGTLSVKGKLTAACDLMGAPLSTRSPFALSENPIYLVGQQLVSGL